MRSIDATKTLLDTLERFFATEPPERKFGVAYSGGRDSGVLLWGLAQVLGASRLTALHVDHGWRSSLERAAEVATVRTHCASLGVALETFAPPTEVVRTEAAARDHRLGCFREFLRRHPTAVIVLAHHADDQAETVLMRLLRGRSWQGLGGMSSRRGALLRPLLETSGALVAQVSAEQKLAFHTDSTNQDLHLTRNFLRHQVLPLVRERFDRAVPSLNEFARVWAQTQESSRPSPSWVLSERGASVGVSLWESWSPLQRERELLLLLRLFGRTGPVSRRSLEVICRPGRWSALQTGVWFWSRQGQHVFWEQVAPRTQKEYFIGAVEGKVYDLGPYRFSWSSVEGALAVPGVDPSRPWFWRSVVPGMRFSCSQDADWGRDLRRRRLGGLAPEKIALVQQDGLIRAVVAPLDRRVVWAEAQDSKLHKSGIFVTLVAVTPFSTE